MLRVLCCTTRVGTSLRVAARFPLYSVNRTTLLSGQIRAFSKGSESEEDEDVIVPEGRKKRVKEPQKPMFRAYLDPLKYIAVTEHLLYFDTQHAVTLRRPEFEVRESSEIP